MTNIHNPLDDVKLPTQPLGNVGIIFLILLPAIWVVTVSLGDPETKIWVNYQVLEEVDVSFIVQALYNGKVQDWSQVLATVVC